MVEDGQFACDSFENAAETLLPLAVNRSQLRKMACNGAFLWIQFDPKPKPTLGPHRAVTVLETEKPWIVGSGPTMTNGWVLRSIDGVFRFPRLRT
jgi:hypothetical protein